MQEYLLQGSVEEDGLLLPPPQSVTKFHPEPNIVWTDGRSRPRTAAETAGSEQSIRYSFKASERAHLFTRPPGKEVILVIMIAIPPCLHVTQNPQRSIAFLCIAGDILIFSIQLKLSNPNHLTASFPRITLPSPP